MTFHLRSVFLSFKIWCCFSFKIWWLSISAGGSSLGQNLGNTELRFRIPGQERVYCHRVEIIDRLQLRSSIARKPQNVGFRQILPIFIILGIKIKRISNPWPIRFATVCDSSNHGRNSLIYSSDLRRLADAAGNAWRGLPDLGREHYKGCAASVGGLKHCDCKTVWKRQTPVESRVPLRLQDNETVRPGGGRGPDNPTGGESSARSNRGQARCLQWSNDGTCTFEARGTAGGWVGMRCEAQVTTTSRIKLRPSFLAENTYFTIKQQQQQSKNSCKMLVDMVLLHRKLGGPEREGHIYIIASFNHEYLLVVIEIHIRTKNKC